MVLKQLSIGLVSLASILICLVPNLIKNVTDFSLKELSTSWYSNSVSYGLYASMILTAFKFVDILIDYLFCKHMLNPTPIHGIVIYLTLPQLIILIVLRPLGEIRYLPFALSMQYIVFAQCFFTVVNKYGKDVWNFGSCLIMMGLFEFTIILHCLHAYYGNVAIFFIAPKFFFLLSSIYFLWKLFCWYIHLRNITQNFSIAVSDDQYCCTIYISTALLYLISITIVSVFFLHESNMFAMSVEHLSTIIYTSLVLNVVISRLNEKILHRQLNQATYKLECKRAFVRYVSHEVRTPLNIVSMGLKLLLRDLMLIFNDMKLNEEHQLHDPSTSHEDCRTYSEIFQDVQDMIGSCNTAITTLNELLTLDKIESGSLALEPKEVHIWSFICGILKLFTIQARSAGVEMTIVNVEEARQLLVDAYFNADPNKLGQVIRNLISNALKFTSSGGKVTIKFSRQSDTIQRRRSMTLSLPKRFQLERRISLTNIFPMTSPSSETFILEVIDTGVGISKENQSKLFKEIIQFNPGELQGGGGSGIGLYISKSIIDLHGGDIAVTSDGEGHGSKFTLKIPMFKGVPKELTGPTIRDPMRTRAQSSQGISLSITRRSTFAMNQHIPISPSLILRRPIRVLVVDDSPINRKMLCRSLFHHCESIDTAVNGSDAVDKISSSLLDGRPYDLVLMDSNMPVMNGPLAAYHMRARGYRGKIIGVTGDPHDDHVADYMAQGADRVLAKPINIVELEAVVNGIRATVDDITALGPIYSARSRSGSRKVSDLEVTIKGEKHYY